MLFGIASVRRRVIGTVVRHSVLLCRTKRLHATRNGGGRTTSYGYDSFGQLNSTLYPDGNAKASEWHWADASGVSGAIYYSLTTTQGAAPVKVWYDALGREIQSDSYGLNAKKISVSTEYYSSGANKGRLYRVSEPYFEADAENKIWAKTITDYDVFGRHTMVSTPIGNVSTAYSGLTTTVTTPEGTTETTLNSTGQTISNTVNGKTVTYAYYASGLTKSSTPVLRSV